MPTVREYALSVVHEHIRPEAFGLLLYGSYARGDAQDWSDIDVLQVVPDRPGKEEYGNLSLVAYLPSQLETMIDERSLFAWHLKSEGIILIDTDNLLEGLLSRHAGVDAELTCSRVLKFTPVLDISVEEFGIYKNGIIRVASYLLRTAIYARALQNGFDSFSLEKASNFLDDSGELTTLFTSLTPGTANSDWNRFCAIKKQLSKLVPGLEANPFGSIEALAIRTSRSNPNLSNLAIHALETRDTEIDYAVQEMPIL